ncbi:hypothetical protein LCGC14_2080060 [marine sediment metagenome]|uniref:Uncharacterized protein n=1 Tax=marine sediment metagenome TaxID=412755 RepID=A0A0F9HCT8_9ZZZZ
MKQYTRIKADWTQRQMMPRLGKIRLGIKKVSQRTGKEYPVEVPYFVVPPEVAEIYGQQPTILDIMFPTEDEFAVFPQALKWYDRAASDPASSVILRCKGDHETAVRRKADLAEGSPEVMEELPNENVLVKCPCALLEKGDCKQAGNLMVVLPHVSVSGVYQIDTGSKQNMNYINSYMSQWLRPMLNRISWVPLLLKRVQETTIDKEQKKRSHYYLKLDMNMNLEQVAELREKTRMILIKASRIALPRPVDEGIDTAPGAVVIEGEVEEEETSPTPPAEAPAKEELAAAGPPPLDTPPAEQPPLPGSRAPEDPKKIEDPATPFQLKECEKVLLKHGVPVGMLPADLRSGEAMALINTGKNKTAAKKIMDAIVKVREG